MNEPQNMVFDDQSGSVRGINRRHIGLAAQTLKLTCNAIVATIRRRRGIFAADSSAMREKIECPDVGEAYETVQIRLTSAIDHGMAFQALVMNNHAVVAPWTVARAMLEQCATIWWLVYPGNGDWKTRIARTMRLARSDSVNFRKYFAETKRAYPEKRLTSEFLSDVDSHDIRVERLTEKLGIEKETKKETPNVTDLVNDFIDDRIFTYRLLSSYTHGRESVIGELMFDWRATRLWRLEPSVDVDHLISLAHFSINWISKASRRYFELTGWEFKEIDGILEQYFDQLPEVSQNGDTGATFR